ncbi:hypothetical protein HK097_010861, partial [Rhizophlyctis rosea]
MADNSQSATAASLKAVDDSVRQYQLVSTLRTADTDSALTAIRSLCIPPPSSSHSPSYGSPLHLAIALCPRPVIERVFTTFCAVTPSDDGDARAKGWEWVNAQNEDGDTPLHLASKMGRADLVEILLRSERVDDTLRNNQGKTAEDVAKTEKVQEMLLGHKTLYTQTTSHKILDYLNTHSYQSVITLFNSDPRASAYLSMGWIDINAPLDPTTEQSILHFAAKADNIELVDWALRHGADPGVKDKKGKKPVEVGGGGMSLKVLRKLQVRERWCGVSLVCKGRDLLLEASWLCPKKESRTKERLKR